MAHPNHPALLCPPLPSPALRCLFPVWRWCLLCRCRSSLASSVALCGHFCWAELTHPRGARWRESLPIASVARPRKFLTPIPSSPPLPLVSPTPSAATSRLTGCCTPQGPPQWRRGGPALVRCAGAGEHALRGMGALVFPEQGQTSSGQGSGQGKQVVGRRRARAARRGGRAWPAMAQPDGTIARPGPITSIHPRPIPIPSPLHRPIPAHESSAGDPGRLGQLSIKMAPAAALCRCSLLASLSPFQFSHTPLSFAHLISRAPPPRVLPVLLPS